MNEETNKTICTCSCHTEGQEWTHMEACCKYSYKKYIRPDYTIDEDKYAKIVKDYKD